MQFYEFLDQHRDAIIERTVGALGAGTRSASFERQVSEVIAAFFDKVIEAVRLKAEDAGDPVVPPPKLDPAPPTPIGQTAAWQGRDLSRLCLDVNQVVHLYGAICDATMRIAEKHAQPIAAPDFALFNRCLDEAIGRAVDEFENARAERADSHEVEHLGFLVHELRNSLTSAMMAMQVLKNGTVGTGGRTLSVLERSLARMRDLIDRSLTEVRLRSDADPQPERLRLNEVVAEITVTAAPEAEQRRLGFSVSVDSDLELDADRQMVISVIANLVQNAIKYSREGGQVTVRGFADDGHVTLEVEDECGGLPEGGAERLFQPFVRKSRRQSGLGLGLTISNRAVRRMGGEIRVRDLPGKGCVFAVSLPRAASGERHPPLH
jgi:signal transduction histidine kinase